jgi:hypothetical protein
MLSGNKNLKDPERKSLTSYGAGSENLSVMGSYTKTHKLITALYMVTDIVDKDEPLRNKLRTLGAEIISDMHLIQRNNAGHTASFTHGKIAEILSFLDIASAINIISEMNSSILKKEFLELSKSVAELVGENKITHTQINIEEFLSSDDVFPPPLDKGRNEVGSLFSDPLPASPLLRGRGTPKGHTRIGVQKGSTLMKALSDKTSNMNNVSNTKTVHVNSDVFEILKKQRRDDIINIIKISNGSATIHDIKDMIKTKPEQASFLISCGEKTIQRELISMIKDSVLYKTGEKRWSRYFVK